ncbi:uncharacterized protein BJ171DRAFT_508054 [Polychytrium aggregatum]|uniref:uncharacterized protein n=1 Tax=Polychytrium aggregatum TaxID=110093 RepID=UPI0022FE31EF|nr:uncharacterized protein BJ171DRAFT_508054 [Polychytrium aggregatum]KAI9203807.1 hypothetical protein BJ171DRAFT_508054 [Polychytrium aggregatum]
MAILAALTSRVCPSLGSARQTLVAGNAWCPRFKPCRSRILAGLAHFSQGVSSVPTPFPGQRYRSAYDLEMQLPCAYTQRGFCWLMGAR